MLLLATFIIQLNKSLYKRDLKMMRQLILLPVLEMQKNLSEQRCKHQISKKEICLLQLVLKIHLVSQLQSWLMDKLKTKLNKKSSPNKNNKGLHKNLKTRSKLLLNKKISQENSQVAMKTTWMIYLLWWDLSMAQKNLYKITQSHDHQVIEIFKFL